MSQQHARTLTVASLVLAIAAGAAPLAHAAPMNHSDHNGNGKFNRTNITINSPNGNNGIQNVATTVIGGASPTQNAFCRRRFRHCRIMQKLIVDP